MKNRNFTNLNINPCKVCMPMGAVMAFKGIENSMVILHGSQGCSTYIRRHMAGHYNEPIDIASSSLNEEGTVYGGEKNLKKGLKNLIELYNPDVIGVATTCLAETIGEDIKRITSEFADSEGVEKDRIIPMSTAGYGGTGFEGYFSALLSIVKSVAKDNRPNGKINVIVGNVSPGDVRNIKGILDSFSIDYIILPDISDTLDSPYSKEYSRIPKGGTRLEDIRRMAGSSATIELGVTIPEALSPGQYLLSAYNVPLYKCPIPMGIENMDLFVNILSQLSERPVPEGLASERGRMLDGMIDSHKYNGEGRAVIYGEPELVYAVGRLCLENGIKPVLIATGSQNTEIKRLFKEYFSKNSIFEDEGSKERDLPLIIDDTDFETIQDYSVKLGANILIGNSDGKIITEKEGIPLVRIGFPIHDRMGGQRQVYTGYNGSMRLIDDITNTLLENKYEGYRKRMYSKYYEPENQAGPINDSGPAVIGKKTQSHPCYSSGAACSNARMHIPVAPACNISCNYCNRKFDCVNESRPGVTSEVLTPEQAAEKFMMVKSKLKNLKVIGIAGPGDALANFSNTKKSIELIKELDPDITFCLSTNGLMLPYYAEELIDLGVSHVTVTINTIDPAIGAKIYREINFMGMKLYGEQAAKLLLDNQLIGLRILSSRGIVCKVNIVMIKGVNDSHIPEVVKKVKECGAFMTNIMPLIPAKGSVFEDMELTNNRELMEMRKRCEVDLKQMYHCKQCRADAIGILGEDVYREFELKSCKGCAPAPSEAEHKETVYLFAVASKSGIMIDQHFGHVEEFYVYESRNSKIKLLEKRNVEKYCSESECDSEESKIGKTIRTIEDCNAVLVLRIGYRPAKALEEKGISVIQTCERIEAGIRQAVKEIEEARVVLGARS